MPPLEEEERRVWDWFGGRACPGSAGKPISYEMVGMLTPTAEADLSDRGCVGGSKNARELTVPSVMRALNECALLKGCKGTRVHVHRVCSCIALGAWRNCGLVLVDCQLRHGAIDGMVHVARCRCAWPLCGQRSRERALFIHCMGMRSRCMLIR